ncbi:MAG TPA: lysylphosphatidylglycerol synthase transmembrane domain-containing protein [Chloroflexota bacterium]|nr:lysylphosphatidylglycerol synthase transmembrane domain-containing protein [Chloroflexota bacterium]
MSGKGRILGFALTLIFLWIVFQKVDLRELSQAFRDADYGLVAPAAFVTLSGYILRTVRWQRIIRPVAPLHFRSAFPILMMGFAANNLLPVRLGEVVRAYLLRRKTGARKTYGVSTIALERVCDGLTLIAILGWVSLMMPLPVWGQTTQTVATLLFLGATVGIMVLLVREDLAVRLVRIACGPLPARFSAAIQRATGSFVAGLHSLKSKRSILLIVAISGVVWALEASSYLLMTRAFGAVMEPDRQLLAAAFLLVVVNLGIMIPSGPGYVGTFQFFAVSALGVFGVEAEQALAIAIASHLMQYILVTAFGLVFFSREQLSFWKLEKETSAEEPEVEAAAVPVHSRQ